MKMHQDLSLIFSLGCCALGNLFLSNPVIAQEITTDGSTSTTVNSDGSGNFTIEQGDRAGNNLFHSFGDFSVPTNGSAFFNNATDISNILSRVTGGNISNIDGLIRANGSANLFLINPAGILFGNNARLDIGGSFLGTTADSILFEDGEFSATDFDHPPLLTINAPIGLNFRDNPGDITNKSVALDSTGQFSAGLEVQPGENISLFGGDLNFDSGIIFAPGGRIELGGLSSAGTITFDENFSSSFPENIARANVNLTNGSSVNVADNGDGFINVNARNINLTEGSQLLGGIFAGVNATETQAGDINLNAIEKITLDNSSVSNITSENTLGNSGNININSKNLTIQNNSLVSALTQGEGQGGNLTVNTLESVMIQNGSGLLTDTRGSGNAGVLTITTERFTVQNSLIGIGTFGSGQGGTANISASESIELVGTLDEDSPGGLTSQTQSMGNAGDLTVDTKHLSIRDGASIRVSATVGSGDAGNLIINTKDLIVENAQIAASTFSEGDAGKLEITASESIELIGTNRGLGEAPSGIFAQTNSGSSGVGGSLTIQTRKLSARNGGQIAVTSLGTGNAGNLTINASDSVELVGISTSGEVDSGLFADTQISGNAGDLTVTTGQLVVRDGAEISADSEGEGRSGNLLLQANSLVLEDQASILASTESIEGGNITLQITEDLTLRNNSIISAQAFNDADGGNLTIDANFIIAFPNEIAGDGNDIIASAEAGNGGNISITVESLLGIEERDAIEGNATNDIDASSDFGLDGTVSIFTPDTSVIQGVTELPNNVVEPSQTVAQACSNDRNTALASNFVIKGKGGIPPLITAPLSSEMITINGEIAANSTEGYAIPTSIGDITPARGVIKTPDGKIILTATPVSGSASRMAHGSLNC